MAFGGGIFTAADDDAFGDAAAVPVVAFTSLLAAADPEAVSIWSTSSGK